MAEPTISIIVPVYKTEAYLEKCVDSILAQTFRDFELLLIDDGSPDNCPALCEEAAARDPRHPGHPPEERRTFRCAEHRGGGCARGMDRFCGQR